MRIKISFLFSVLLLFSCTLGPDYKSPRLFSNTDIAAGLRLSGQVTPITLDWYRQFNDPLLNSLIARGLAYSPTVEAARQRLLQARQSLRISAVQNLPTLNASGAYNKSKTDKNYRQVVIVDDYYRLGFDAAWELDIWGGGRRATESAWAMLQAAAADLDNVRLTLTAEIAANYIRLRQAQEQLRLAEQNLQLQEDIYQLVRQKYNSGLADEISINQAGYIVDTTKQQLPVSRQQTEAYANALSILVGQLPGSLTAVLSAPENNLISRNFAYDLDQLYNLPVSVLRQRPDVRVAEANLMAQNAKIGQALAQMFPSLSISGLIGYQAKNSSALISSGSNMYSFSPVVNLPLFHWGALYNNVQLQKYLTAEQLQLYRSGLLNAAEEIRTAMTAVEQEYLRNQSAVAAERSQTQVAELTLRKYRQGLVEFSEVLTSQQNLLSAQNTRIESNGAIYQNIITFYKSIGGGYAPPAPKISNTAGCRKAVANAGAALCKG